MNSSNIFLNSLKEKIDKNLKENSSLGVILYTKLKDFPKVKSYNLLINPLSGLLTSFTQLIAASILSSVKYAAITLSILGLATAGASIFFWHKMRNYDKTVKRYQTYRFDKKIEESIIPLFSSLIILATTIPTQLNELQTEDFIKQISNEIWTIIEKNVESKNSVYVNYQSNKILQNLFSPYIESYIQKRTIFWLRILSVYLEELEPAQKNYFYRKLQELITNNTGHLELIRIMDTHELNSVSLFNGHSSKSSPTSLNGSKTSLYFSTETGGGFFGNAITGAKKDTPPQQEKALDPFKRSFSAPSLMQT